MKRAIIASTISAIVASSLSSMAFDDESNAAYWNRERNNAPAAYTPAYGTLGAYGTLAASKGAVAQHVATRAKEVLGDQWVAHAVKTTKIESNFNCKAVGPKTRHGRAIGAMQVLVASAAEMGIDEISLRSSCTAQIEAGIRYMNACIKSGVTTASEMSSCYVSGIKGWKRGLNRRAERYRNQYIKMALAAQVPAWVGTLSPWRM